MENESWSEIEGIAFVGSLTVADKVGEPLSWSLMTRKEFGRCKNDGYNTQGRRDKSLCQQEQCSRETAARTRGLGE